MHLPGYASRGRHPPRDLPELHLSGPGGSDRAGFFVPNPERTREGHAFPQEGGSGTCRRVLCAGIRLSGRLFTIGHGKVDLLNEPAAPGVPQHHRRPAAEGLLIRPVDHERKDTL